LLRSLQNVGGMCNYGNIFISPTNTTDMKQLSVLLLATGMAYAAAAQHVVTTAPNPYPRTITVNGSAELEVIPDEIYVQVDFREYDKKGEPKVSIDQIKKDFLQDLRSIGVPDSAISIASYEGYSGHLWWRKRKKDPELYATISYQVKFNSSYKVDELVNMLDDDATTNFQVVRTSHSKINEFRKQLKIQAMKAAKDKALYLTEAVNEKLGEAITITEPADVSLYYYSRGLLDTDKNKYSNVQLQGVTAQPGIDFKKIRLKFDVNVLFALK
jgi:uncharacterized protein